MNTHYYRYLGYRDGSGKPDGIVIRCYTEEYANYIINIGYVLERIEEQQDDLSKSEQRQI